MYMPQDPAIPPDVGHIAHQPGTNFVSNLPEALVVPLPGVCTASTDEHLRAEVQSLLFQLVIVNVPCLHEPAMCCEQVPWQQVMVIATVYAEVDPCRINQGTYAPTCLLVGSHPSLV